MNPLKRGFFANYIRTAILELIDGFIHDLCPNQIKIAHNLKFELIWCLKHAGKGLTGIPGGKWRDSMLLAWMMDERSFMTGLKIDGELFNFQ